MKTTLDHKKAIRHLRKVDPVMAAVIAKMKTPAGGNPKRFSHFQALVESIASQQLSAKAANTIIARFRALFKQKSFPNPEQVMRMPTEKIRGAGLSYGKASFIKDLARLVQKKEIALHSLHRLEDEQVIEHLVQVKGIGRWTAEMFLMFSLERPDVFSHGDLGLRNAIQKLYGFKKPPTVKQIEKIVQKWRPYRTLGSRYLWRSLDN
jgi:DNA-3-methyladenine glycosylase II